MKHGDNMIHTIIICLSIIVIVGLICYTCYKVHISKVNQEVLDEIHRTLGWLKSDCRESGNWIEKIWDNIQEVKSYLRELNEKKTKQRADSTFDRSRDC